MTDAHSVNDQVVSLIICAYTLDRWQDLCEAVASAQNMTRPPDEIILVCDHNDELFKKLSARFSGLCVVANEEQRGLSGARNTGVRHAKGQLMAFLDDDAIAGREWLSILMRHFNLPGVYGATSRIEPLWIGDPPAWMPLEFLWTVGCSYAGLPIAYSEVRNVMGAAMCFRRDVFDATGGFTHRLGRTGTLLPLSCEETELSIRAREAISGATFVFDPSSTVQHKIPAKRLSLRYFMLRCYAEGLSKQRLAGMFRSKTTLSTEAHYVLKTLPRGVLAGFRDAVLRGDAWGLGRAGAIVLGLAATASGYAAGMCLTITKVAAPLNDSRALDRSA
ncbi:MAG: glycosyltransferase family 2 protein [Hyphomicrobium sp.]